jgi:hypothetical protein
MLASAHKLAAIGANFLICPDNTIHQALPFVELRSPLPWVLIAEVVATRAAERGFRCLGLIARVMAIPRNWWLTGSDSCVLTPPNANGSIGSSWMSWCMGSLSRRRSLAINVSFDGSRVRARTLWSSGVQRPR